MMSDNVVKFAPRPVAPPELTRVDIHLAIETGCDRVQMTVWDAAGEHWCLEFKLQGESAGTLDLDRLSKAWPHWLERQSHVAS